MNIKALKAPGYTDEELSQLVTDLLALTKVQIEDFLGQNDLRRSGTKTEKRERIEKALNNGAVAPERLIQFLDAVTPWGKQHVYLYKGPSSSIADWKTPNWLISHLRQHRVGKYLNAALPLALPEEMKLSSILYNEGTLRITAIKKREWWEREPEYDESKHTPEGEPIALRAFIHRVTRSMVAFEWDLTTNTAFLQISQLPGRLDYEEIRGEFFELVTKWLDPRQFSLVDLRPRIQKLHELEETGTGETRSHGINYRTLQGRRLEGRSATPADPLLGEPAIDTALSAIRKSGVGHLGNFYWLPNGESNAGPNPLETEVHVIIVGFHGRVNFPTPNGEQAIRHVLSRIRSHGT